MVAVFFERLHSLSDNRPSMLGPRLVFYFPSSLHANIDGRFSLNDCIAHFAPIAI